MVKRTKKPTSTTIEPGVDETTVLDMESDMPEDVPTTDPPLVVEQPTVAVPATKLVNVSGEEKFYAGMMEEPVKPGDSCAIPKDRTHVQFLCNHGFELA